MRYLFICISTLFSISIYSQEAEMDFLKMEKHVGFISYYYDDTKGAIYLEVPKEFEEILYVNSLSQGLGSNDIGLDRGQLGGEHVVYFKKMGNSLMLIEKNLKYRAISDNVEEVRAVEEAFAKSVIWGFPILKTVPSSYFIDLSPFLKRDAHGVIQRLLDLNEGTYQVEKSRSAINVSRTKNFPNNTEFDALITLVGKPGGEFIQTIGPDVSALSVYQHHAFIRLPDNPYEPRAYDPGSGYIPISYFDYATPIHSPLEKKFITRHRLETKTLSDGKMEVIHPIVYYLDRGCPEPVRSALLEGGQWWNQAFEAAGYINAFRVEMMPEGADPMDVRYNVIQWVHRSTRGWSYGSSVTDPRTGEIIKGHVSLGSLRVRQDYLIAQGLDRAYNGIEEDPLLALALARLRQLAAHEVGHTLGLAHNFAASVDDRSSVMDYPYPIIAIDEDGNANFTKAYATGIGDWDKRTILYGYGSLESDPNLLDNVLSENQKLGMKYISDRDARPLHSSHPQAHLWDNGSDAIEELERLILVRKRALKKFGPDNLQKGRPQSELETILVPLYLSHRYQIQAVSKLIGGVSYDYGKNDGELSTNEVVSSEVQHKAIEALLKTLSPDFLTIPKPILDYMLPRALGYSDTREHFERKSGLNFDPISAAASSSQLVLDALLHPQRLNRISIHRAQDARQVSVSALLYKVEQSFTDKQSGLGALIQQNSYSLFLEKIMSVYQDKDLFDHVRLDLFSFLSESSKSQKAYQNHHLGLFLKAPLEYKTSRSTKIPAGSPIGCFTQREN